jgi:hypothetical protein
MDTIIQAVTPLRQRMLEDMRLRTLEPRTQEAYIRAVRKLAAYLHRSPDTATVEDLRNFQLHLVCALAGEKPVWPGLRRASQDPRFVMPGSVCQSCTTPSSTSCCHIAGRQQLKSELSIADKVGRPDAHREPAYILRDSMGMRTTSSKIEACPLP